MFYLIERDWATIFLDAAALILIAGMFIMTSKFRKKGREDDTLFLVLLILNAFIAATDCVGYIFDMKPIPGGRMLCMAAMTVFYVAFNLTAMVWFHYCGIRFMDGGINKGKLIHPVYLPGVITICLVFISAFTGWIFMYDEAVVYHRGPLFIPMYILDILYVGSGFLMAARYQDRSSGRKLVPVWVYAVPIVFGAVFTFAVPNSASFAAIGIAISISYTHMAMMNEVLNRSRLRRNKG